MELNEDNGVNKLVVFKFNIKQHIPIYYIHHHANIVSVSQGVEMKHKLLLFFFLSTSI